MSELTAISLWQPWASLVALGKKRVETRSWPPARRGIGDGQRLAIHATLERKYLGLGGRPDFSAAFREAGVTQPISGLPLGALVATVTLVSAVPTESLREIDRAMAVSAMTERELAFGDFSPGRWAWLLADVELLESPVPWKGRQGPFKVTLP